MWCVQHSYVSPSYHLWHVKLKQTLTEPTLTLFDCILVPLTYSADGNLTWHEHINVASSISARTIFKAMDVHAICLKHELQRKEKSIMHARIFSDIFKLLSKQYSCLTAVTVHISGTVHKGRFSVGIASITSFWKLINAHIVWRLNKIWYCYSMYIMSATYVFCIYFFVNRVRCLVVYISW